MCNGCAMNFALSDLGKIRKEFVFLGKDMVRPGGFELPTFWFVASGRGRTRWCLKVTTYCISGYLRIPSRHEITQTGPQRAVSCQLLVTQG